jgi:peroxiredoxin/uncharacterized membrane protein YphA (DoxX/SURF4 family)
MGIIALVARLVIAATFALAGVAKFVDLKATRKGITDFGVPNWAVGALVIVLPLAEILVAGLLIPSPTVIWGSIGAIALLLVFITSISINLAQGRKPSCNCFGQLHSEPVGPSTLVRNSILTGVASIVLWQAHSDIPLSVMGWRTGLSNAEALGILLAITCLVLIATQAWLTFHLLRQNGQLLLRMDALEAQTHRAAASLPSTPPVGLPIGSSAPAFELPLLSNGSTVTLEALKTERRPILMIFSDPNCGPCSALMPDIARWEREYSGSFTVAVISRGSQRANRAKIGEHKLRYVLLQKGREVATAYQANITPAAVLIGIDGQIGSYLAMGAQAITALVATSTRTLPTSSIPSKATDSVLPNSPAELKVRHPAPSVKLPDLTGKIVDLSAFRGRDTLVLFWNPSCNFCAKMLPALVTWEKENLAEAPQLFVISTGSLEANLTMGLGATVVLDPNFASGMAFHVRGTPAAVLVDAEGNVASGVANGATAVFDLANASQKVLSSRL